MFPTRIALPLIVALLVGGCRSHETRTTIETRTTRTVSPPSGYPGDATLEKLIADLQQARTPQAEADAIRALRKYETDHGLTYNVRTIRTDTNQPAAGPTALNAPLRTEISLFKGQQPLRTFSFIPKDNRNLALLGE